jgi:hypothetical protein
MVINHAEATKNCVAGKKFGVTEGNVHKESWHMQTCLKAFSRPKKGCFHELEQCIIECVHGKCSEGFWYMR